MAEHKTGFRNAVRRNRTSAIDDVLAVLRRCREARSGTSIRVGPSSHRFEGTTAKFADGAKSIEYVPRDGSVFGEAWLRQGVADAVGAAENLYVHPDDKAAYDTMRKDPRKPPSKTGGPVVRTGPTAGENRSRNQDGRWRKKRDDTGVPRKPRE